VSPLLYWRLEKRPFSSELKGGKIKGVQVTVPEEATEGLERDYYTAAAQGMLAEQQLADVLRVLGEAEVPTLVIKGAAIGAFYPDPALRPYGDLDLLVPQSCLERAEAALNRLDYWCSKPKAWWSDTLYHLPPMVRDGGWLTVEIHWRLEQEGAVGRLPTRDLWARAVSWGVGGQPAFRLDSVDMALHLCQHAVVQHRTHLGLRPLCDLVQVTEKWDWPAWELLVQRAVEYGLSRPIYLMLTLAERALHLTAPARAMSTLRLAVGTPLPDGLVERLLSFEGEGATRVPLAAVQAGARGTVSEWLQHILWHLFLPRNGMAVVYGIPADSPRIWLAYLRRPVDLLRRYSRTIWGVLRGSRKARAAWQQEAWLQSWLAAEGQQGRAPHGEEAEQNCYQSAFSAETGGDKHGA